MTMRTDVGTSGVATNQWIKHGIIGGIIGGLAIAVFDMVSAAVLKGPQAFFGPLREISGIVLGQQALEPTYPLLTAGLVGVVTHMTLSIIYGIAFAGVVAAVPQLRASSMTLIIAASLFGLALWLINFYVIAPVVGWTWFAMANPVVQFIAHTFFFGTVLGIYLDRMGFAAPRPTALPAI
ncbi:MAG: hypothetical protein H0U52_04980 [Chloroflexi bacterium]|nr:hypothetical protein [Chloroflexota bacterium]